MTGPASNTAGAGPLSGTRILDLTTFLSGPFCTQILADLGAEVVKVETPAGDSARHIPPHFVREDSVYYLANNRDKRSLSVDMKTPEGLDLVRRLIAEADVVVDNFRPGVLAKLGLDIDALRAAHPTLIWASITGFGQEGATRDKPAYDMIVQALSGVMSLNGEPGRPAARLGIPAGDTVAGLYATIGICAALAQRATTGRGRAVDVAMLDCQLAMLSYQSAYALNAGVVPGPQGAAHDSIPTYRSFMGSDGRELVVTAITDRQWHGLCAALDLTDLAGDPRFTDGAARLAHRTALWKMLEEAFATRPAADWVARLAEMDVPAAPIKSVPEALEDARHSGRGMVVAMEDTDGTRADVVGGPIRFDNANQTTPRYPPSLGADAADILSGWLGLAPAETDALAAAGVLRGVAR